ncbi:MAG: right-handed parallel beta-helix repeat-containing protein [Bryobacteraceae bacterium]
MKLQLAFLFALLPTAAATLNVSPAGPLSTLAAARDKARELRRAGDHAPITVSIYAGVYFLAEPLILTAEDSDVIYEAAPGEHVVVSGGRKIEGWKKVDNHLWSAPAPFVFHEMFVAGRRAQRARTPNQGYFRADGLIPRIRPFVLKFRGEDIRKEWSAHGGVEVNVLMAWQQGRAVIAEVDPTAHTARLSGDAPQEAAKTTRDARYWIENAPDGLDEPGEWQIDRDTKTVYYWPESGEDLTRDDAIAPAITQLARLEGSSGAPVHDIAFRRLDFRHTEWTLGPNGYTGIQAAYEVPAAIDAQYAENISIENCRFTALGGYAISLGRACRKNKISANQIFDAGAGGVRLGGAAASGNKQNTVTGNDIHNMGLIYPAGVGVLILQSSDNLVAHNHIHDLYYTAISVGWSWGYKATGTGGNRIEYNHLHDIGKGVLSDMGGIYTLGVQPGTVLRNNLIHDVTSYRYGGWGIYLDEGTSGVVVENNVVYHCRSAGFNQHYGQNNAIRNNVFALNHDYQMTRSRAEPHLSFTFERNIVYFDSGRLLGNNWTTGFKMDRNIYWDVRGNEIRPAGHGWSEWRQSGHDAGSEIADPRFVNPSNFDFTLAPDSPALKLGIQSIDVSTVGPRVATGPE